MLPTARLVRLTLRAVCEERKQRAVYGVIDGKASCSITVLAKPSGHCHSPSSDETGLVQAQGVRIQGIFMQPDLVNAVDGKLTTLLMGRRRWSSDDIQHYRSPRHREPRPHVECGSASSSAVRAESGIRLRLTARPHLCSKGDLIHHWLCCISYEIDRDWMWDALQNRSFVIHRTAVHPQSAAGGIQRGGGRHRVKMASFEALDNPQRNSTRSCSSTLSSEEAGTRERSRAGLSDTIEVSYSIEAMLRTRTPRTPGSR